MSSKIKKEKSLSSKSTNQNNGLEDNWQATKATIKECFQFLLNNEKLADVHFIVGKSNNQKKVPAHKFMLVARSVVFETMFLGSLAPSENEEIKLPDVEPDAFLAFLKFLYIDIVEINEKTAMSILYLGKKYIIPRLQQHCVNFLKKNCKPDNVFFLLRQARLFEQTELENHCLNMIDTRAMESFAFDDFADIDLDTLIGILKRETLKIDEYSLFEAVLRWTVKECARKKLPVTPTNQRSVLGEALKLIRFPLMSIEKLVQGPVQSGLLDSQEVVQLLIYMKGDRNKPKPSIPFINIPRMCDKYYGYHY